LFWCCAVVVCVDPFNYFGISHIVDDKIKRETSLKLHPPLWKSVAFRRCPAPNILLGDSRMDRVQVDKVKRLTGEAYSNLAYGGGTIPEIIGTFWYVARSVRLERVYIGVNFNLYNSFNSRDRWEETESMLQNPLYYFVNTTVLKALWYNVYCSLTRKSAHIGEPAMSFDSFWRYQLVTVTPDFYARYQYPSDYRKDLEKIAEYCRAHGISLVFIIPPTHVDLQREVSAYGLLAEERRFKDDLKALAKTVDLDYDCEFSRDRKNFIDPYHVASDSIILEEVWGHKTAAAE